MYIAPFKSNIQPDNGYGSNRNAASLAACIFDMGKTLNG